MVIHVCFILTFLALMVFKKYLQKILKISYKFDTMSKCGGKLYV